jgi:transposase
MYQEHRRRQRQAQAKREMEEEAAEETSGKTSVCVPGYNAHEKLYEDAARRRDLMSRKLKEKEAEEEKKNGRVGFLPTGWSSRSQTFGWSVL